MEAQEMFRVSNKVSRPEKALILGFMAGSRGTYSVRELGLLVVAGWGGAVLGRAGWSVIQSDCGFSSTH